MLKQIFAFSILFLVSLLFHNANAQSQYDLPNPGDYLTIVSNTEGNEQTLQLPIKDFIFNVTPHNDQNGKLISLSLELKPGLDSLYNELGYFNKTKDTVVFIYPSFTQAASEIMDFMIFTIKNVTYPALQ